MKKVLFYLKLAFIVILFAWVAYKFDYDTAKETIAAANMLWGLTAVIMALASLLLISVRWKMIVLGFWEKPGSTVFQLFWFNLLATFVTLFLPTSVAGEAVRIWRLAQNEDKDYTKAAFTSIIDRLIGICTWFVLFLLLPSRFPKNMLLLLVLLVPIALYFFRDKLAYKGKKLMDFSRHNTLDIIYAFLFSILAQTTYMFAGYSVLRCFNLNIDVFLGGGLIAAGSLVSLIPISLLGFGVREGFFIATLPLYGAAPTQAVFVTSYLVFINYLLGAAGGLVELMNTGWNLSKLKNIQITAENEKT